MLENVVSGGRSVQWEDIDDASYPIFGARARLNEKVLTRTQAFRKRAENDLLEQLRADRSHTYESAKMPALRLVHEEMSHAAKMLPGDASAHVFITDAVRKGQLVISSVRASHP
eukprot:SAG22_NODE_7338_length_750_cov_0.870968_1_plen_113_part_10